MVRWCDITCDVWGASSGVDGSRLAGPRRVGANDQRDCRRETHMKGWLRTAPKNIETHRIQSCSLQLSKKRFDTLNFLTLVVLLIKNIETGDQHASQIASILLTTRHACGS